MWRACVTQYRDLFFPAQRAHALRSFLSFFRIRIRIRSLSPLDVACTYIITAAAVPTPL